MFMRFYGSGAWNVAKNSAGMRSTNAIGWVGGGMAAVAIAAASQRYGMSASLSATSLVYLLVGLLLAFGIWTHMRRPLREVSARVA